MPPSGGRTASIPVPLCDFNHSADVAARRYFTRRGSACQSQSGQASSLSAEMTGWSLFHVSRRTRACAAADYLLLYLGTGRLKLGRRCPGTKRLRLLLQHPETLGDIAPAVMMTASVSWGSRRPLRFRRQPQATGRNAIGVGGRAYSRLIGLPELTAAGSDTAQRIRRGPWSEQDDCPQSSFHDRNSGVGTRLQVVSEAGSDW